MQTNNRMNQLPITLATLLLVALNAFCEQSRPNVIFMVSDDLNCYLGAYGNKDVISPNIDKLAARGTVFTNAACQFPVCGPSRSSFMSGLRPNTTGIISNGPSLYKTQPGVKTIPSYFKNHGYVTARAGKIFNHVDNNEKTDWDFILDGGITPEARKRANTGKQTLVDAGHIHWNAMWRDPECRDEDLADGANTLSVSKWIKKKKDKPFFLAMGFLKPHRPLIVPKKYYELYDPKKLYHSWGRYVNEVIPATAKNTAGSKLEEAISEEQRMGLNHAYYATVSYVDAQVGKLMQALDDAGLKENTIVVLFGDNGTHLGEHLCWGKNMLFEASARVPLIIADPANKTVRTYDKVVELIDLFPTLIEMCELPQLDELEGKSLQAAMNGTAGSVKAVSFSQVQVRDGWSVRTDRWRLINADPAKQTLLLYDLKNDPHELNNQINNPERSALVAKLKILAISKGFKVK